MMMEGGNSCKLLCGYLAKIVILFFASAGVVLSIFASNSCQFLYSDRDDALMESIDPAINNQPTEGWVGIFKYNVVPNETMETPIQDCSMYETLWHVDTTNEALFASQLCAIIAPCLALVAILLSAIELVCCKFAGSFTATAVLFLAASLFQCGTFVGMVLIEPKLCFDSDGVCEIGKAAYFSASGLFAFWTSCILLCCSPRPSPCRHIDIQIKGDDHTHELTLPTQAGSGRTSV